MSEFCQECSIAIFGEDFGELAHICKPGESVAVLCEECGEIDVDYAGKRIRYMDTLLDQFLQPPSYWTIMRKGEFKFYWCTGPKHGIRIGVYREYYDGWMLAINLYLFSLEWTYA